MGTFALVEYQGGTATGKVFTFSRLPKRVKKDVKLDLRIRNHGLKWFKLVRFRNRLTETYTLNGQCTVYEALLLQHYLKRQSRNKQVKFRIKTDVDALKIMKEDSDTATLAGSGSPWVSDNYFVIASLNFDIPSGKPLGTFNENDSQLCINYTLTLEMVE